MRVRVVRAGEREGGGATAGPVCAAAGLSAAGLSARRRAVVGGEDEVGVVQLVRVLERLHQRAHQVVVGQERLRARLVDEIEHGHLVGAVLRVDAERGDLLLLDGVRRVEIGLARDLHALAVEGAEVAGRGEGRLRARDGRRWGRESSSQSSVTSGKGSEKRRAGCRGRRLVGARRAGAGGRRTWWGGYGDTQAKKGLLSASASRTNALSSRERTSVE